MAKTLKLVLHVKVDNRELEAFRKQWNIHGEPDTNSICEMIKTIINSQMLYPFIKCIDVKPLEKTILEYVKPA